MTDKIFDSLNYKKSLESVGIPTKQAEKQIEIMGKIINNHLATKDDLKIEILSVRHDMQQEFTAVRSEMAMEFAAVRAEMAAEFAAVRSEMAMEFAAVRAEMAAEFTAVRSEMAAEFAAIRSEMNAKFATIDAHFIELEYNINKSIDRKLGWGLAFLAILMTILKYI